MMKSGTPVSNKNIEIENDRNPYLMWQIEYSELKFKLYNIFVY